MYRWLIEKDGKASSDAFYDLAVPRYLYCHYDDPVCDFLRFAPKWPPVDLDMETHLNYGADASERATLANKLVEMAAAAAGKPPLPTGTPGPVDVMFAIDTTGSMTPYLSAAVDSAAQMAEALRTTSSRARVGLVEYRDYGDSYVARTVVALTDDFGAFEIGLNGLAANGGGDTPEAVYTGIVTALGADWDRSASRALIVLGDAPAHDPETATGLTAAAVADIAKGVVPMPELPPTVGDGLPSARVGTANADAPGQSRSGPGQEVQRSAPILMNAAGTTIPPVKIYGLSANSTLSEQLTAISTATGGQTLPISAPDDVTESIIKTVEDAATAPIAKLTVTDTIVAGSSTVLSGLGSSHVEGGATFGFDFDGNGTIDETTAEGAARHIYASPGPVTARLVVTDSRGRTAEATAQFVVRALDSLRTTSAPPPSSTSASPPPSSSSTIPTTSGNLPPNGDTEKKSLAYTGVPFLPIILATGGALLVVGSLLRLTGRRRGRRSKRT